MVKVGDTQMEGRVGCGAGMKVVKGRDTHSEGGC